MVDQEIGSSNDGADDPRSAVHRPAVSRRLCTLAAVQALVRSNVVMLVPSAAMPAVLRKMAALFVQCDVFTAGAAAVRNVFLAIDRPDMRRVAIAIRPADAEIPAVRVNPLPQVFA